MQFSEKKPVGGQHPHEIELKGKQGILTCRPRRR
jgi:hypothetical protein